MGFQSFGFRGLAAQAMGLPALKDQRRRLVGTEFRISGSNSQL